MPTRLITVVSHFYDLTLNFIQQKVEFAFGGTSGLITWMYFSQSADYINITVKLLFAFISGAVGTLGGLIVKSIWESWQKRRNQRRDAK